jgi:acyl carrier protein
VRTEFLERLEGAEEGQRYEMLYRHVEEQVMKVLGLREGEWPEGGQGFFEMGMDSLTSLELKNRLQASLGYALPATIIFDAPNIEALTKFLAREAFEINIPVQTDGAVAIDKEAEKEAEQQAAVLSEIKGLSEAEVIASIAEELAIIKRDL